MADAVTVRQIRNTPEELVLHLTNISDGTGESAVNKAAIASFTGRGGAAVLGWDIKAVRWCMQGINSVRLLFDAATDDVGYVLSGNGYDEADALVDPRSGTPAGNLLLTTQGAAANGTYDITIWLNKRIAY